MNSKENERLCFKSVITRIKPYIMWISPCILVIVFWAFVYPYHILFTEQLSLFLYSSGYLREYALMPGGWAEYVGNFLSQFYINKWTGALIQTLLFVALTVLARGILKKIGATGNILLISLFPALLLWALQLDNRFTVGNSLMFISPFALTLLYINISSIFTRRLAFSIAIIPVYLISDAIATCSLYVACVIYELFYAKDKWRYSTTVWLIAAGAMPPLWQKVYIMHNDVLYQILNYQLVDDIKYVPLILLAFTPLCLLIFRIAGRQQLALLTATRANKFVLAFCIVGIFSCGAYLFSKTFDLLEEQKFGMHFSFTQGNWERVLKINQRIKNPDQHTAYFANMALSKQGMLPERMFHYSQTDENGLLLLRMWNDFNLRYGSDYYHHVGILNEAIRWIYDAHISRSRGMDYHTLTRLALWNKEAGYEPLAAKYFDILENTLMYRSFAKRQRSKPTPENIANNREMVDFYIGGREILVDMAYHFDNNLDNEVIRDFLLCYLLLKKDLPKFLELFNFSFSRELKIPQVYQEALLMIAHMGGADIRNYHVDAANVQRFSNLNDLANRGNREALKKHFGNTWWYYFISTN